MWYLLLGLWRTAGDQTLALLFVPHALGLCNKEEGNFGERKKYWGSSEFSISNTCSELDKQEHLIFSETFSPKSSILVCHMVEKPSELRKNTG